MLARLAPKSAANDSAVDNDFNAHNGRSTRDATREKTLSSEVIRSMVDTAEDIWDAYCEEWLVVESNESVPHSDWSDEELLDMAAKAILVKNHSSLCMNMNEHGRPDPLPNYPKLVKAASKAVKAGSPNASNMNAHVVLAMLYRYTDHAISEEHFKQALEIEPDNWRIQAQLASTYMMTDKLRLCLTTLNKAIDLCPSDYDNFDLRMRKGKLLCNLGRAQESKDVLEQVFREASKYATRLTQKEFGHIAVAQYMLSVQYANGRDETNALYHWEHAEAKRDSLPSELVAVMDWSSRACAFMNLRALNPNLLCNYQQCHFCRTLVKDPKKCSACKAAFYCDRNCQLAAWKSGHKRECKQANTTRNE